MDEIKVTVHALGFLMKFIPNKTSISLNKPMLLKQFVFAFTAIPKHETNLSFVVNGKAQKADYLLQNNDEILVLKIGGAG